MTAPVGLFSCAASHTNSVAFRLPRPSANGPFHPHCQPPGYPSPPESGASKMCQCWVSKKFCSQRRRGGLIQNVAWDFVVISSARSHLVVSLITRLNSHCNGDVERRLQASTTGNRTGDGERLAGCVLLQGLYQWKAAVNRDRVWNVWLQESETTMCQHAVNLKTELVTYSVKRWLKTMCDLGRISCSTQNSDLSWKYSFGSRLLTEIFTC